MTTTDYLESLQDDLSRTVEALNLEEGTNFTDIADMAENGEISTGGGADLSEYFASNLVNSTGQIKQVLKKIPLINTSSVTDMSNWFAYCNNLIEMPQIDTSNVTNISSCFSFCTSLTTIPVLDLHSISGASNAFIRNMFTGTYNLTDTSLDNLLQSLITAVNFSGTKTLANLGLTNAYYPASRIEALPHYQDFIDAGWTIGY